MNKASEFGELAGLKINKTKSKLMFKNMRSEEQKEISQLVDCEVVNKYKYLGIELTNKNIDLFKNNYERVWRKIKEDLVKWNSLNLSLMGRISVIKMNVLPRILFLLQNIPII